MALAAPTGECKRFCNRGDSGARARERDVYKHPLGVSTLPTSPGVAQPGGPRPGRREAPGG